MFSNLCNIRDETQVIWHFQDHPWATTGARENTVKAIHTQYKNNPNEKEDILLLSLLPETIPPMHFAMTVKGSFLILGPSPFSYCPSSSSSVTLPLPFLWSHMPSRRDRQQMKGIPHLLLLQVPFLFCPSKPLHNHLRAYWMPPASPHRVSQELEKSIRVCLGLFLLPTLPS